MNDDFIMRAFLSARCVKVIGERIGPQIALRDGLINLCD
jgi:hypothetical protein